MNLRQGAETSNGSNLSETASFVGGKEGILTRFVTPALRERGLTEEANRIIEAIRTGKLKPDDGEVIEFALALREVKSSATMAIQNAHPGNVNADEMKRSLAVVDNYTRRLIKAVEDSSQYKNQTPPESAAA